MIANSIIRKVQLLRPGVVWTAASCFLAALALLAALDVHSSYRRTLEISGSHLKEIARTAELELYASLRPVRLLLQDIGDELQRAPNGRDEQLLGYLRARTKAFPELREVFATNAQGGVIFSTLPDALGIDARERPYFTLAKAQRDFEDLSITKPIIALPTKQLVIFVSMPVRAPGNGFKGVIAATLNVDFFNRLCQSVRPAGRMSAALIVSPDGDVLARDPDPESYIGKNVAGGAAITAHKSQNAPDSVHIHTTATDGLEKLSAVRTMKAEHLPPLIIIVSRQMDEVLHPWRLEALAHILVFSSLALLVLFLAYLLARHNAGLLQVSVEAQTLAQQLAQDKADLEQFAFAGYHDLKAPLRTTNMYLQLLERRFSNQLDADGREFIGFARDGIQRMSVLVTDLLSYIRAGHENFQPAKVDLNDVLEEAKAALKATIEETGAVIEADWLPMVTGSKPQLVSLFQNLLANAMEYRREDAPPHIRIKAGSRSEIWEISVADNGIGIDPQYCEQIFELFKRLHASDKHPGTGIGLSLARKVVANHGGRIWVESVPGQGSTFFFTLPYVLEEQKSPA